MPVDFHEEAGGKVLVANLRGKLTRADYERFQPEVEQRIRQQGKVRMLVRMHDFHGWELGALWEDIKFDMRHFRDIERLAFVGDRTWEAGMAAFCKPFTTATIRYFDQSKADEALHWISEGIRSPTTPPSHA